MDTPASSSDASTDDSETASKRSPGYDVFISHSSKDKSAADAACHALEARDIRCWIAPRDIRPGANWGEAILEGISSARIMVLLLSSNANTSPQIQREVERAVHHGAIVIPMRIEEVMPAKSLEYFLSTSHWLDAFRPPLQEHLHRLADTVQGILGQEPSRPAVAETSKPSASRRWTFVAVASAVTGLLAVAGWWQFQHAQKPVSPPASLSRVDPPAAIVSGTPTPAASPTPAAVQVSVLAPTPTPSLATTPTPPAIAEFAGAWEISTMIMKDSEGNEMIYQPIRFTISESGQVTGKATATMESKNGKPRFVQPPRVTTLTGTISAPENKKHMASGSTLDASSFSYRVAAIQFKLSDGTEGRGLVGLTDNLPVAEYVTMSRGEVSGRMVAMKQ